jgi:hypothetical protein
MGCFWFLFVDAEYFGKLAAKRVPFDVFVRKLSDRGDWGRDLVARIARLLRQRDRVSAEYGRLFRSSERLVQ